MICALLKAVLYFNKVLTVVFTPDMGDNYSQSRRGPRAEASVQLFLWGAGC